jgi:GcrA cell cycle regulator
MAYRGVSTSRARAFVLINTKPRPALIRANSAGASIFVDDVMSRVPAGPRPKRKPVPSPTASPISKAQPRKPILAPARPILVSGPTVPTPPSAQPTERITGIPIFDLRERHCRWPVGNDRPAKFFCGAPAVPSKSWCEHHYGLAYGHRPTRQSREPGESLAEMLLGALQKRSKTPAMLKPADRSVVPST